MSLLASSHENWIGIPVPFPEFLGYSQKKECLLSIAPNCENLLNLVDATSPEFKGTLLALDSFVKHCLPLCYQMFEHFPEIRMSAAFKLIKQQPSKPGDHVGKCVLCLYLRVGTI